MSFGLRSILILAGIIAAVVAAACVFLPDSPKFEAAVYLLSLGVILVGGAHFVRENG